MAGVNFQASSALTRVRNRVNAFSQQNLDQVRKRAIASTARALKAETARAVADLQLNLSTTQISPYISVAKDDTSLTVSAANKRLALGAFRPTFSTSGASATTWRDKGPYVLAHGFNRSGQVWQRAPGGHTPSGLVGRFPIVLRKGPSLRRALEDTGHGGDHNRQAVVDRLAQFTKDKLSDEVARLISAAASR